MARARFRHMLDEYWLVRRRDVIRLQTEAHVRSLVARLGETDPSQLATLLEAAGVSGSGDDAAAIDRLVDVFLRGDLALVRIADTRTLDPTPSIDPRRDPRPPDPDRPVVARPTWISLEAVDEAGKPLPHLGVEITFPEGTHRSGRFDEAARFRADDVPEDGTCVVTVAAVPDLPVLGASGSVPEGDWIGSDGRDAARLSTRRHHRLVVVAGRTEVKVVDAEGAPAKGVFWQAMVAGKTRSGVTDERGAYVLHHPRAVESCEVELTKLDGSAWRVRG